MSLHILNFVQTRSAPVRLEELLVSALPCELLKHMELPPQLSNSKIRRLIVAGAVSINGKQVRVPASLIQKKSVITVRMDTEKFSFEKKPDDIAFELTADRILYEDECLIVVNKPPDFPTEATMVASRDHLHAAIKRYIAKRDATRNEPYIGVHHRLDRETSGVILFTKTRTVNAAVHDIFFDHRAQKEYVALTIRPNQILSANNQKVCHKGNIFTVDNFLGRITPKSAAGKWGAVSIDGDPARTDFCILDEYTEGLCISARPLTGRTHQIRVHLAGRGLPLFGDVLYGGPTTIAGNAAYTVPRIMLHAKKLTIPHPVTGTELIIEAPLPEDFLECMKELKNSKA